MKLSILLSLVLASPCSAAIVYTDLGELFFGRGRTEIFLDISGDGNADIRSRWTGMLVDIRPITQVRFQADSDAPPPDIENNIIQFEAGSLIGAVTQPGRGYQSIGLILLGRAPGTPDQGGGQQLGSFVRRGFAGFEITLDDGIHYGWMDIDSLGGSGRSSLFGFAYESIPGKSILAGAIPEPSSGVLLAATAAAICLRRKIPSR